MQLLAFGAYEVGEEHGLHRQKRIVEDVLPETTEEIQPTAKPDDQVLRSDHVSPSSHHP